MPQLNVAAETRQQFGKNSSRRLRQAGKIPAILYGNKEAELPLTVSPKDLMAILHSASGHNTIFSLEITGQNPVSVMLKDWQFDPIKGRLLHADMLRIALDKVLQVKVPILAQGEAKGVKEQGGIFEFVVREVEVECLPVDIPEHITIDVSELALGQNLRVSDLPVGDKIKVLSDADLLVAHVIIPRAEKAAATPEEAPVDAAAEPEVIKKGKAEEEGAPAKGEEKEKKPAKGEEKEKKK
jgi:large subunit ribosomal protein L25